MSTELAVVNASEAGIALRERLEIADVFAASGLFPDTRSGAQAYVKIQAGAELGFPPFASMNGISIIQNRTAIGGGLYAALIEACPDYDLEVLESSDTQAAGRFWVRSGRTGKWEAKGEFSFSMEDAQRAGLAGKDNWKKNPRQMLYWRMVSNGARMFFPARCAGLYLPEELGATVTEQGEIIESVVRPSQPESTNWEQAEVKELLRSTKQAWADAGLASPTKALLARILHCSKEDAPAGWAAFSSEDLARLRYYAENAGAILPARDGQENDPVDDDGHGSADDVTEEVAA